VNNVEKWSALSGIIAVTAPAMSPSRILFSIPWKIARNLPSSPGSSSTAMSRLPVMVSPDTVSRADTEAR